jgi:hypothetical protein
MKKLILSAIIMLTAFLSNAQQSCHSDVKRNNGNNCTTGGTGGGIEIEFLTKPNDLLQIDLIESGLGEATVLHNTKVVTQRSGKWYVNWCFETDNLGPVSQGNVAITFFIDSDSNGTINGDEKPFICSQVILPIRFKSISTRRMDANTIRVIFESEEDNSIKHYNIRVSFDGRIWKTYDVVFPGGVQGSKRYQVDLKNVTNKNK